MDGGSGAGLRAHARLAGELADLKRIRDARNPDSLATRAFRHAWAQLAAGADPRRVALATTADALAAARLGAIDHDLLVRAGLIDPSSVLMRGFDEVAAGLPQALQANLRAHVALPRTSGQAPGFVVALAAQPRAGATCPGKPRLILEPPENHAEHCLLVAVLGVVLSAHYGADPATVFVAGLAHHLHNAMLPDSGFAGETLLGTELAPLMARLFDREIATLAAAPARDVRTALATIGDADTPEGRAFHAADVIDRVLQMHHYDQVARFTTGQALDDLELVHAGPVQSFHRAVLAEAGLP